jgi:hypothetical protein
MGCSGSNEADTIENVPSRFDNLVAHGPASIFLLSNSLGMRWTLVKLSFRDSGSLYIDGRVRCYAMLTPKTFPSFPVGLLRFSAIRWVFRCLIWRASAVALPSRYFDGSSLEVQELCVVAIALISGVRPCGVFDIVLCGSLHYVLVGAVCDGCVIM